MGIVFHSGGIMKEINEGEDFFNKEFNLTDDVAKHINKGDIVGVCTGSGGDYILKFRDGYPAEDIII